jgi:hypothetical protein
MRFILPSVLLLALSSLACGAENENPFLKAKVGDWAEYKMTGQNVAGTTKMVITAKDDKEVTYEVTSKFKAFGQETTAPPQTIKVDLKKSYDPDVAANLKNRNTKIEKLAEGSEKVKVGGKEIEAKWTKQRATTEVSNMKIVTETKMWCSKDVPISGMVKMESTTTGTGGPDTTTTVELTGSGSK